MMNVLSITAYHIIFAGLAILVIYASAITILYRNKSGLLPYLAVLLFPIIGPLGIILGNYMKRTK